MKYMLNIKGNVYGSVVYLLDEFLVPVREHRSKQLSKSWNRSTGFPQLIREESGKASQWELELSVLQFHSKDDKEELD